MPPGLDAETGESLAVALLDGGGGGAGRLVLI